MAQRAAQKGPPSLKQSKLNFKPGPENGPWASPRLAPEVAAHAAAEREREQREREQQRAAQMAASDVASGTRHVNVTGRRRAARPSLLQRSQHCCWHHR
jgi:hypothetical protein